MSQRRPQDEITRALESYNAAALTAVGAAWGVARGSYPRKQQLIEALARRIAAGDGLAERLERLAPAQREAIAYAARGGVARLPSVLRLLREQAGSDQRAEELLVQLLRAGLLLMQPGGPWKVDLSLADPTLMMRSVWAPLAVAEAVQRHGGWRDLIPPQPEPEPARVRRGDPAGLLRDIFMLLRSLRGRPLRLTQQESPHQADLRRLVLELRPQATRQDWRGAADSVTFAIGVAAAAGLLDRTANGLGVADESEIFLEARQSEQVALLFAAWQRLAWSELQRAPGLIVEPAMYGYLDIPDAEDLQHARRLLCEALAELVDGDWRAARDLSDSIRQRDPEFLTGRSGAAPIFIGSLGSVVTLPDFYSGIRLAGVSFREGMLRRGEHWELVEGAFIRQALAEPLSWLGVVDTSLGSDGQPERFRVTPLGATILAGAATLPEPTAGPRLIVQPSFEIVVLDAARNLQLLHQLDAFAEQRSVDRAAVYQLTQTSVTAGLQGGLMPADMLALLEGESGAPLPQNVRFSLDEWAARFERVTLRRRATLLEVPEPAILDDWLAEAALAARLRRLGPTVALVTTDEPPRAWLPANRTCATADALAAGAGQLRLGADAFTLAAAPDLGRFDRARLECLAEPLGEAERRLRYRLTAASLGRAQAAGWTAEAALDFFHRRLGRPLPPETRLAVRGWLGGLAPVRGAAARLLRLPDAAAWPLIERAAGERQVLRLGPDLALVEEGAFEHVARELVAVGMSLRAADLLAVAGTLAAEASQAMEQAGLQPLRGRALRRFLEAACADSVRIVLLYQPNIQRPARRQVVQPHFTEQRPSGYYLQARTESGEERRFNLDRIMGVAREEQI